MKVWLLLLFGVSTAAANIPDSGCVFDCGPANSVPAEGCVLLTPESRYDRTAGYGWELAPGSAFHQTPSKHTDSLTVDGVSADSLIQLRVDLQPGRYLVTITLGGADEKFRGASVTVNDVKVSECAVTPWYRLLYHSVSTVVTIPQGTLRVAIAANRAGIQVDKERVISLAQVEMAPSAIALNAVDVRPLGPYPVISFATELEPDSSIVASTLSALETSGPSPGRFETGAVFVLRQYLKAFSLYVSGNSLAARRGTGFPYMTRLWQAIDALQPVLADSSHPLFDRALFLLGKIHFWLDKEEGEVSLRSVASQAFTYLRSRYPHNIHLRMYLGEKIDERPSGDVTVNDAPEWASKQRRAMQLLLETVHWWVDHQTADGEMGGGFGDDVEMLRDWFPAVLGADDEKTREGFQRLADGVWESGLLRHGYLAQAQDVEHSAEFVSDTQPAMMIVRYGDPEYVERGFLTVKNIRDHWTGVNLYGHRHFRSSFIGADSVLEEGPFAVDHTMNARAAKHALWLAWYTHDSTALNLLSEWGESWVDDALRMDNEKPSGIIPPAVSYVGDRIGGLAPEWFDPRLGYDYYTWESFNGVGQMYDFLLGLYSITGNRMFMGPLQKTAAIANRADEALRPSREGSLQWVTGILDNADSAGHGPRSGFVATVARAHSALPLQDFRSYLLRHEDSYSHYCRTGEVQPLVRDCDDVIERLRYNVDMRTSEVRFTDRVDMPPVQSLYSMYTGSWGRGNEFPSAALSWEHTGTDVAILAGMCTDTSMSFRAYSFDSSKTIVVHVWTLLSGTYQITSGSGSVTSTIDQIITERGERVSFELPSRKEFFGSMRRMKRSEVKQFPRPDIALSDLTYNSREERVYVVLHNIGNSDARDVRVELLEGGRKIGVKFIGVLPSPVNLIPQRVPVSFDVSGVSDPPQLSCSASTRQPEICSFNNQISIPKIAK